MSRSVLQFRMQNDMAKKQTAKKRKPGPGRPKGVPNRVTTEVKKAILEAFEKAGGVDYLVNVAMSEPKAFCALLGKIVPAEIAGTLKHEGGMIVNVVTGIPRAPNE